MLQGHSCILKQLSRKTRGLGLKLRQRVALAIPFILALKAQVPRFHTAKTGLFS